MKAALLFCVFGLCAALPLNTDPEDVDHETGRIVYHKSGDSYGKRQLSENTDDYVMKLVKDTYYNQNGYFGKRQPLYNPPESSYEFTSNLVKETAYEEYGVYRKRQPLYNPPVDNYEYTMNLVKQAYYKDGGSYKRSLAEALKKILEVAAGDFSKPISGSYYDN